MTDSSRIPGFYKLSLDERRRAIAELARERIVAAMAGSHG